MTSKCKKIYISSLSLDKKRSKNRGTKQLITKNKAFLRCQESKKKWKTILQYAVMRGTKRKCGNGGKTSFPGLFLERAVEMVEMRAKVIGITTDPPPAPPQLNRKGEYSEFFLFFGELSLHVYVLFKPRAAHHHFISAKKNWGCFQSCGRRLKTCPPAVLKTQFVSGVSRSTFVDEHTKNMKRQQLGTDVQPSGHEGN